MRYATARYQSQQRDLAYRFYVSDCLRIISESSAMTNGGPFMSKRFFEMMNPKEKDCRSGEEIAADIFKKMGVSIV